MDPRPEDSWVSDLSNDGELPQPAEVEGAEDAEWNRPLKPEEFDEDLSIPYMKEYGTRFEYLVKRVWDEEHTEFERGEELRDIFDRHAHDILASMNDEVVKCIIEGSLPRVMLGPEDGPAAQHRMRARKAITKYGEQWREPNSSGQHQPVICAQYLTDDKGEPPYNHEVSDILAMVTQYAEQSEYGEDKNARDDGFAEQIDTSIQGKKAVDWYSGKRLFVASKTAYENVNKFVESALKKLPTDCDNERQSRTFSEFGYSLNAHQEYSDSAFIRNLVEAVCAVYFPRYQMQQFVVYKTWAVEQGWIGEVLLSRIGSGYISSGHGLGHQPAEPSNNSADTMDANLWNSYMEHAIKFTPFLGKSPSGASLFVELMFPANYKEQTAIYKRLEDEMNRVARLKAELEHEERVQKRLRSFTLTKADVDSKYQKQAEALLRLAELKLLNSMDSDDWAAIREVEQPATEAGPSSDPVGSVFNRTDCQSD